MTVELLAVPALLMSMTEIAELAKVQRPVVTTWRRRHRDFPAPAGGDAAQPLFDPRQVADWLISSKAGLISICASPRRAPHSALL